ncbi:SDR family NAD(P)-dependent oxidoreductase [Marinomonas spartinae]|uniref:SDR family NAD(P)-dependent oxidoreductase n=1 Tax=Marinomonas spartinae TaxID=1792290 RepID=UPI0018F16774|nr:SDR family NAD(P)-dependent oxidoreductase [Marinomonas spartinae]MBJ7554597.1 SDR family NAD(P)-dependent oxidoreductase [Marinomonas spartinae]
MSSKGVVWITGASSGIGLSLAKRYLYNGFRVIVSARHQGELAPLIEQNDALIFVPFDVSDNTQIESVRETLLSHTDHLDCAILNAGTCEYFEIDSPDWDMMQRIMSVNYLGLVHCVEACLPLLRKAAKPHLVGVSSQAVQAAFTKTQAYGASKAAIRYFLSSLRIDLKKENIDVTCILPGFVDTPLTQKNTFPMPFLMPAEQAAARIERAIERRPYEYAFPKRLSVMLWLARHFPKLWSALTAPKE